MSVPSPASEKPLESNVINLLKLSEPFPTSLNCKDLNGMEKESIPLAESEKPRTLKSEKTSVPSAESMNALVWNVIALENVSAPKLKSENPMALEGLVNWSEPDAESLKAFVWNVVTAVNASAPVPESEKSFEMYDGRTCF